MKGIARAAFRSGFHAYFCRDFADDGVADKGNRLPATIRRSNMAAVCRVDRCNFNKLITN